MISLPKLLLEAAGHKASEVVLAVGERPSMSTPQGRQVFGESLGESEFFEALTGVLAPEQQAELAVGNMVEFRVTGPTGEWKMVVEPSADGLVVRGRRANDAAGGPELEAPMDLPPLAPFEPDVHGEAPAPEPVLKRRTRADLGLKSYDGDAPPWAGVPEAPPPVPEPEPEPEPAADPDVAVDGKSPLPPPPPVADLGPSRESGVDFAIVPDEVGAEGIGAQGLVLTEPPPGTRQQLTRAPRTPAQGVPRRSNSKAVAPLAAPPVSHARREVGTLTFYVDREQGHAAAYAEGESVTVLDEPRAVDLAGRMLAELVAGATYLVQLEDPSRVVAWLLRRLEEGSRIFVETRASTLAGAERIFVGLHGEVATMWLAEHEVVWLSPPERPHAGSAEAPAPQTHGEAPPHEAPGSPPQPQ